MPRAPATIEETGLSVDQIAQLFVKIAVHRRSDAASTLADRLRLPYALLEPLVEHIRAEQLIEVRGASGSGTAGYRYALTDLGRDRAQQYLDANQYVGAAPVPLAAYVRDDARAAGGARLHRSRPAPRSGFSDLIVGDERARAARPGRQRGPRGVSLRPAWKRQDGDRGGHGARARRRHVRAARDRRRRPDRSRCSTRSITSRSRPKAKTAGTSSRSSSRLPRDRRWVRIRRPVVMVGGELTLDMLDLNFNPIAKFHEAPIQLKANGGVFLVDDFGRQRMTPQELLNRWIVPLESRVDLPDAAHRQEDSDAVRRADRLRDQPRSGARWPTKRSCAAFRTRLRSRIRRSSSSRASSSSTAAAAT